MIEIRQATTDADFKAVGSFYLAFKDWSLQTYPEFKDWAISSAFLDQLEAETRSFPGIYAPPAGCLLLATFDGAPAGTVGLADLGQKQCEMRRMFVDSQFRGAKIGRALGDAIIDAARKRDYTTMRLKTMPRHFAALSLYRSLGFEVVKQVDRGFAMPAGFPDDLQGGEIAMELQL